MRKYVFKAQDSNKKWVYGLPLERDGKTYIINLENTVELTEVDRETLSEFTNRYMEDEETEIYENDIIYFRELYWTIKWCEPLCGFQAEYYDVEKDFPFMLPITQIYEGEVKGNIFDNPELINIKKE